MGFFMKDDFEDISEANARLAFLLANRKIMEKMITLYGVVYEDNSYENFSTEKKVGDTHTLMVIGSKEMGMEPPKKAPIKIDEITKNDIVQARLERLDIIEKGKVTSNGQE